MSTKDDKLIIRVTPGLKKRIESTAKKQGKNVSDFVRDIITMFLDKEQPEYLNAINKLRELFCDKEILQNKIYTNKINDSNLEETEKLILELVRIQQKIYEMEKYINYYLNSKDI